MIWKRINLIFFFLLLCSSVAFATEDLTTYSSSEECTGRTTITSAYVQYTNMRRYCGNSTYYDFGADYFGQFDIDYDSDRAGSARYSYAHSFHLSDTAAANWNTLNVGTEGLTVNNFEGNTEGEDYIQLEQHEDSNTDAYDGAESTVYYMSVIRTDSTIQAFIYSDSGRATLLDTLSVTYTATKWRYYGVICGHDTSGNEEIDLRSGNVTINQADAAPPVADTGTVIHGNTTIYGDVEIY